MYSYGSSHHEPMMRAHKEYTKRRHEVVPWDYADNPERIEKFFTEVIEKSKDYENIITIGMRGDGDAAIDTGNDADFASTNEKSRGEKCPGYKILRLLLIFSDY